MVENELASSEKSICPNAQNCRGSCHNQQVETLSNSWKYALMGAYAMTDYQPPTQDTPSFDSNESFEKNANDYDNMLKQSLSDQSGTYQSSIDQVANMDAINWTLDKN